MTILAPDLFTPRFKVRGRTAERDAYLREYHFVDPAILAAELGLTARFIVVYLRKLGLRTCERKKMI